MEGYDRAPICKQLHQVMRAQNSSMLLRFAEVAPQGVFCKTIKRKPLIDAGRWPFGQMIKVPNQAQTLIFLLELKICL